MAEFCKQCADDLDFTPENNIPYDFVDLQTAEEWEKMPPNHGLMVLCEGCGPTVVNKEGECIATNCELHGVKANA